MYWDETARKTGAKLISCCGHDAIPWDLSVHLLADYMNEECNDDLVKAECLNDMKGGGASGTFSFYIINHNPKLEILQVVHWQQSIY